MKSKIYPISFAVIVVLGAIVLLVQKLEAPAKMPSSGTTLATSTSPIDIPGWKTYSSTNPAFSIKYPSDLAFANSIVPTIDGPYLLELQFPKDAYFSTVLKDDVHVIVTASSSCPVLAGGPIDPHPQTVVLGGTSFVKSQSSDAAAGNRYLTIAYDTTVHGICYRITFFDHGANGAGLYLSDPALIQAADTTHGTELSSIEGLVESMTGTFSVSTSQ